MIDLVPPSKRDIKIAVVLYTLNIVDMIATLVGIRHGMEEMNPIMNSLLQMGEEYFVFVKVFVFAFFTFFLLYVPISKKVNTVLLFLSGMYMMLVFTHILIFWSM